MNVEFEPSSLQIKVNEVMNVMHAKPHRLCLSLSRQTPAVYVLCVWLFFFPRGHFFILSLISSLEAIARAVALHGGFPADDCNSTQEFAVTRNKACAVLTEDSYFYFLISTVFCPVFLTISALKRLRHHQAKRKAGGTWNTVQLQLCGIC